MLKLQVQPGDGIDALVKAIDGARKTIQIMIFRFDQKVIEAALDRASDRGVFVHALIAFTNRGGEDRLRRLEGRLLERGITVARTADDLVRYHAKFIIVDGATLFVLAYNFTHLDIERSRSFGALTDDRELVREAQRLFECDVKRLRYKAGSPRFVVSPVNARAELERFIKGTKRELLIWDPQVSDKQMLVAIESRRNAGVVVRIIGKVSEKKTLLQWRRFTRMRLHTRTILRDGTSAFVGSQSLRKLELDERREVGIIFRDAKAVGEMRRIFEQDWEASKTVKDSKRKQAVPMKKTAKKVAKVLTKKLPVRPVVAQVVQVMTRESKLKLHPKEIEDTVKEAVKDALKDAVKDAAKKVVKTVVEEEA